MCSTDIFLGLLAVLFPPLPVWVKRGICSADGIINLLLCLLGFIPGLLHAWYIIAKYPEPPYDYDYENLPQDPENGRIYVFVHNGQQQHHQQPQGGYQSQQRAHAQPPKPQGNMNYGTAAAGGVANAAAAHQPQEQGTTADGGEAGPSDGGAPPPSYAQVVAGDHKVQTHD
ncbi:hypothetical protein C8A00DRAFT_38690 [Chaetomidium leptoderma]|uniref:Stress response RCI peptide n=1 Tax=Chaetomidium leptoderma TaxID=669021 RepID=A0AAN6VCB1_9PEZI|nr:hypothetical protein C8A00DRAFT_38690 [Chaetomidium leptoderma]